MKVFPQRDGTTVIYDYFIRWGNLSIQLPRWMDIDVKIFLNSSYEVERHAKTHFLTRCRWLAGMGSLPTITSQQPFHHEGGYL